MSAPLRITERLVDGVLVLQLAGHLVFDEGDRIFREHVAAAVDAGRRFLLVDLEHVTYIDSGGVGALVEVFMRVLNRGGRLTLLRPNACAMRVLDMTRLTPVFEIFHDEEQAVVAMRAPARPTSAAVLSRG